MRVGVQPLTPFTPLHPCRQAGLQQYLKPEELEGKLLCVVSNLKPAKLAGSGVSGNMPAGSWAACPLACACVCVCVCVYVCVCVHVFGCVCVGVLCAQGTHVCTFA